MIMLFIVGVIALVVGSFFWLTNRGSEGDPNTRRWGFIASGAALVVIVASIVLGSFTSIPAGYRGVVIRFSNVTGTILEEGLQTKLPFFDSVVDMSIQTQKYEADSSAVTNDLQDVSTTIALNNHEVSTDAKKGRFFFQPPNCAQELFATLLIRPLLVKVAQ